MFAKGNVARPGERGEGEELARKKSICSPCEKTTNLAECSGLRGGLRGRGQCGGGGWGGKQQKKKEGCWSGSSAKNRGGSELARREVRSEKRLIKGKSRWGGGGKIFRAVVRQGRSGLVRRKVKKCGEKKRTLGGEKLVESQY